MILKMVKPYSLYSMRALTFLTLNTKFVQMMIAMLVLQNRLPSAVRTAKSIVERMNEVWSNTLPGYLTIFRNTASAPMLLEKHNHNVDAAMIEAYWRYSIVMGEDLFPAALTDWPWTAKRIATWVVEWKKPKHQLQAILKMSTKGLRRVLVPHLPL